MVPISKGSIKWDINERKNCSFDQKFNEPKSSCKGVSNSIDTISLDQSNIGQGNINIIEIFIGICLVNFRFPLEITLGIVRV